MRSCSVLLLLLSAWVAWTSTPLAAQRFGRTPDHYPLGGLDAWGEPAQVDKKIAVEIKRLDEEGAAARAGLAVGDRILMVDGKRLAGKTPDAIIDGFCLMIEGIEAKRPKGEFARGELLVTGAEDKERKVAIELRPLGPSPRTVPGDEKALRILKEAVDYLAGTQGNDGNFPGQIANGNQACVTASLAGLVFLGAGQSHRENYEKALNFVLAQVLVDDTRSMGDANWNQTNWKLGYGAIFLAEAQAQDPRDGTRETLEKVLRRLEENQEESGGYAHGPGGPNALNYLELSIVSNYVLAGMGMSRRLGLSVDDAKAVRAIEYLKSCTSGGGVAYSTRPGQAGSGDPGRTAGAYWALRQMGRSGRGEQAMFKFFERGLKDLPEGHVSPAMHLLGGALAAAMQGQKPLDALWAHYLPWIMASRIRGGAFDARPTSESRSLQSNSDRSNGPAFITAHYALVMMLGQGRFRLLDQAPEKS